MKFYLFLAFYLPLASFAYPEHWWKPVPAENAPSWEILPQEALPGEVILSKRNELGILSNFAPTPFIFKGKRYASIEGLWQMMKYPESKEDPRSIAKFPYSRDEVSSMVAFEAKEAGNLAELIMKDLGIDWVSFEGRKMKYCSESPEEHYELIKSAMWEKLKQNKEVQLILKATGDLKLRPDHHGEDCQAPEWKYYEIWMEFRELI